ncbi:ABC transporter permease [Sphaerobacter thermophilus]|uniref:Binding-protein-dependent transport systems inner membrane component n=1 Tax=Sphaerobacter thermophilus (strain ATCC 49802 / DSM 20745 / KCCM 41009 / NCIMB 13125 / S 6022) TaxID=479434 RepID=D1C7X4_SPHTD|nr:ABC transporter permease [Sphaerobacter thermophilus]ACZ39845.1 binding-protein-dependent transport systems inner membrane component [Sphaerobacter thermophilus DSM 20745]
MTVDTTLAEEHSRHWFPALRLRSRRVPVPVLVGTAVLALWVVVALTVQWWAPFGPLDPTSTRLSGPSLKHPFGTDALGRDVFTRTLYGAKISLRIAVIVIAASAGLGCLVGAIAGFFRGWVDEVLMRISDITLAFPPIVLAMAITAALGPGIGNAMIAMIIVWWPVYARLLRGQILVVREQDHVLAAVAMGASPRRLMARHILPLSMSSVLVNATMDFGQVVLLAASLSFIGLGAVPPEPEWGAMIREGAARFYHWWVAAGPGLAILSVALASNFLGDGIRDFLDPSSRRR